MNKNVIIEVKIGSVYRCLIRIIHSFVQICANLFQYLQHLLQTYNLCKRFYLAALCRVLRSITF